MRTFDTASTHAKSQAKIQAKIQGSRLFSASLLSLSLFCLPAQALDCGGSCNASNASVFRANVSFTEHPLKQRLSGAYQVVTVESVDSFLQQQWPDMQRQVLKLEAK